MTGNLAYYNSSAQTSFENSPPFLVPKILREAEIKRPEGYVLPGLVALSVDIEANGFIATGYGEGPRSTAREKAISEAFERLALFKFCANNHIKETSSGWAAHRSPELAIRAALMELIERDVALNTWENGGPFLLVPETLWPKNLIAWTEQLYPRLEFSNLRIALSSNENGACISALLLNEDGNFVAGHASAFQLEDAILSAMNECLRASHSAIQFDHFTEVAALHAGKPGSTATPGAHSLAYAYKETMPEVMHIVPTEERMILSLWRRHQMINETSPLDLDVQLFKVADRIVARVKSPRYRPIFWGRTNDLSKRNQHPHFVG